MGKVPNGKIVLLIEHPKEPSHSKIILSNNGGIATFPRNDSLRKVLCIKLFSIFEEMVFWTELMEMLNVPLTEEKNKYSKCYVEYSESKSTI